MPQIIEDITSSPLMRLYDLPFDETLFEECVKQHIEQYGRLGFHHPEDGDGYHNNLSLDSLQRHFSEHTRDYLERERGFLEFILQQPNKLEGTIQWGFDIAKRLLPERVNDYQNPVIFFGINGHMSHAINVSGYYPTNPNGTAGINLHHVFSTVDGLTDDDMLKEAMIRIAELVSHEANHIFSRKLGYKKTSNKLLDEAFDEGFAALTSDYALGRYENPFLDEIDKWPGYFYDALDPTATLDCKLTLLNRVIDEPTFQDNLGKDFQKVGPYINRLLGDPNLTHEKVDEGIYNMFYSMSGPLYAIGYHMWSRIFEQKGIEGVRKIVEAGVPAFVEAYRETSHKQ